MDWLDLLAVQGTLKSLLQHHSSEASIPQCSAFFMVQLSHPYMTTGKTIALTIWTFVGKVMSLLFNMLSRLVITFLPRRKRLLISWLQSPSAVILEPPKTKPLTVPVVSPSICHEVMGPDYLSQGDISCSPVPFPCSCPHPTALPLSQPSKHTLNPPASSQLLVPGAFVLPGRGSLPSPALHHPALVVFLNHPANPLFLKVQGDLT